MRWFDVWRLRFRSLFQRRQVEHELSDEFAFHLEQQIAENIEQGMEPSEARAAAMRMVGGIAQFEEECRDERRTNYIDEFVADVRYGLRGLRKNPGFAAVAILILALGIGASTAIFSLAKTVLFLPLPFAEPERLAIIYSDMSGFGQPEGNPSPADYLDWKAKSRTFEDITAASVENYNLTGVGEPVRLSGLRTTENFFDVMRVAPAMGRLGASESGRVVFIGYGLWQRRFGRDAQIVGKTIQLNNQGYVVAGVAPASFQFPDRETDLWVPQNFTPNEASRRQSRYLIAVGRIKRGVSLEQARSDMTALAAVMSKENRDDAGIGVRVVAMRDYFANPARTSVWLLFGAAGALLLMVCSNIAHLMLARGVGRGKEIALRASLGAGRARVIRQLLTESSLLAGLGAAVGVGLSRLAFPVLVRLIPSRFPAGTEPGLDLPVLLFTAMVAIASGVLFGAGPTIQASRLDLNEVLKQTSARASGGRAQERTRGLLVAGELALTVVLLIGGGLLLRSYANLRQVDVGFQASHLMLISTVLSPTEYRPFPKRMEFARQAIENVKRVPGVVSAGYTNLAPLTMRGGMAGFVIEGRPAPRPDEIYNMNANIRTVSADYFATLAVPLLKGRMLDDGDTTTAPRVLAINETMARTFWPDGDAVGKRIQFPPLPGGPDEPWYTVAGVVGDIKQMGLDVPSQREMYFPLQQTPLGAPLLWPQFLVVRTAVGVESIGPQLRAAVASVDPNQPVSDVRTMDQWLDTETLTRRTQTTLLGGFAAIALILAAAGLYGVLSYTVAQRTSEIGLRMALGAQRHEAAAGVVRSALLLASAGIVIGLIAAWALGRTMSSFLFEVSPTDPFTFGVVTGLLGFIAVIACLVPARRAAKIDPLIALRHE